MPDPQNVDSRRAQFVAEFVGTDDEAADLARGVRLDLLTDARMFRQAAGRRGQGPDHRDRGRPVDGSETIIEAAEVRDRPTGPLNLHLRRLGNGTGSRSRLSAHAWTA